MVVISQFADIIAYIEPRLRKTGILMVAVWTSLESGEQKIDIQSTEKKQFQRNNITSC